MKNSQYTFFILVISWFFFIIGCSVTAAYMKVSTQFDTQTKKTEAAQASKLSESELYDSKYEVGKTEAKLSDFMKKYYEYLEEEKSRSKSQGVKSQGVKSQGVKPRNEKKQETKKYR